MSDDETTKKLLIGVLVAVLGGNAGVIALNKTTPSLRADAFTGHDAKEMESELKQYIDHKFAIHKLQIPPQGTRSRIFTLEEWAKRTDPAYKRPTSKW